MNARMHILIEFETDLIAIICHCGHMLPMAVSMHETFQAEILSF